MSKNLGKRRVVTFATVALAAALALALAGCKNFMKSDDDVKEKMQQEVDIANAPQVTVNVQSSSTSLGSVTPNGNTTFKVNVPLSILASETTGGFIKWAAFYNTDLSTEVKDAVTFSAVKEGDMKNATATVLQNRPDIVIQAMFEKRPSVTYYFPDPLNGDAFMNSPIRLTFSKPVDPASLTTTVNGAPVSNITITEYFGGVVKDITTTKYGAASVGKDNKVVILKNIAKMSPKNTVTVKVAKGIKDTSGLEMADDYSFSFKVGLTEDNVPPNLGDIVAGLTNAYEFPADEADRRIRASQGTLYVRLRGDDSGAGVDRATITPTLDKYDEAGNRIAFVSGAAQIVPWIDDANTPATFAIPDLSAGDAGDGLITLSVVLTDGNDQSMTEPTLYRFVRDTTAPITATEFPKITSSGGTGFYNKSATLSFSNATPIVDYGYAGGGSVPRLRSGTAYYRVTFNPADFTANPTAGWIAAGSGTTLAISSYTGADSAAVPVYAQLKDDLGNASGIEQLRTIPVDNNPPTGCSVSVTNATPMASLRLINGNTLNYALSASDAVSGVMKYCVKTVNAAPTAGEWVSWPAGSPASIAGSTSVDATDGQKTLYAWFQDGAGNPTTVPVTDTVIRDGTSPTIEKFHLRAIPGKSQFAAATETEGSTACSNSTSYYFMFVADDTTTGASGFSTFKYSDNKGGSSGDINVKTGVVAATVSNVNVAALTLTPPGSGIPTRVFVTGILTVSNTNDEHELTLTVKDGAGNESAPRTGDNHVLYDSAAPKITGVSLAPDAGAVDFGTTTRYTNKASRALSIMGEDTPNGSAAISGLDKATLTATGGATVPASQAFSGGVASASITLNEGPSNVITVTPWDKAGNAGTPMTYTVIFDKTPPTLVLELFDNSGTSSLTATKATTDSSKVVTPLSSKDWSSFRIRMNGIDGGSGVKPGAVHSYQVFRRTTGPDEEVTLSAGSQYLTNGSVTTISLPEDRIGANKSATWLVSVKARDNVDNVMPTGESIGFVYDVTPPSIDEASVKITLSSDDAAVAIARKTTMASSSGLYPAGTYYFIPGSKVSGVPGQAICVQIKATDKPAGGDAYGSGLAKVRDGLVSYPVGNPSGETHNTESTQEESDGPYIVIGNGAIPSWNFAGVALMKFAPTVIDKCGNEKSVSTPFYVVVDDGLPTATHSFTQSGTGKTAGVTYLSTSSTMSFTPTDPMISASTYQRRASGTYGYFLSTSPTPPDVPESGLGSWVSCSDGTETTVSATSLGTAVGTGIVNLYLHLLDNAGNRNAISLGRFTIDKEKPTLSGIKVTCPSGAVYDNVNGVTYVTDPSYSVYATAVDDATGSGLANRTVEYRSILLDHEDDDWGSSSTASGSLTTEGEFFAFSSSMLGTSAKEQQVLISVSDKVGNSDSNAGSLAASAIRVRLDTTAPTASATLLNCSNNGSFTYISSGTTMTLSLIDSEANKRVPSGIKGWIIQKASTAAPTKDSTWTPYLGTAEDNEKAAKALLDLVTVGQTTVDLYTIDKVNRVSAAHHLNEGDTFMVDLDPPTVTITSPVSSNIGADGSTYYVSAMPKISFSAIDNGASGLDKYYYSTNADETIENITEHGTDYEAVTAGAVTGFDEATANIVYLYVSDKAGNKKRMQLVANASKKDPSAPSITKAQAWSESQDRYTTVDDDGVMTVKISYAASAETVSGVKTIMITGNLASPSGVTVSENGFGSLPLESCDFNSTTKVLLIKLKDPIKLTLDGFLYVRSVQVAGVSASYTVTVLDAAGNEWTGAENTVSIDSDPPSSIAFALSDGDTGLTTHSSEIAKASGSYSETKSELYSLTLSDDVAGFDSATLAVACGGTTYRESGTAGENKLTVDGLKLILDPPCPSSLSPIPYTVSGIKLTKGSSDGNRKVTLAFTNTAERSASANDTIDLDTTGPVPSVQAALGEKCAPTEMLVGSNTEEKTLSLWVKSGTSLTMFLGATDVGSRPVKYLVGAAEPVTVSNWGSGTSMNIGSISGTTKVQVWDGVGNVSSINVAITEDKTGPTFNLTPDATKGVPTETIAVTTTDVVTNVYTKEDKLTFDFDPTDNGGSGVARYTLYDVASTKESGGTTIPSTLILDATPAGNEYTLTVTDNIAIDPNVSKKLTLRVYKDSTGPTLSIPPDTPIGSVIYPTYGGHSAYFTTGDSMKFTVTATDGAGVFNTTATGGTLSGNQLTVPATAGGTTVKVRSIDELGNPNEVTFTVTKDDDKPGMTVKSPSTGVYPTDTTVNTGTLKFYPLTPFSGSNKVTVHIDVSDKTLDTYSINGVSKGNASSSMDIDFTAVGDYPIEIRDHLGHSESCTVSIVDDTGKPTLKFTPKAPCTSVATTIVSAANVDLGTLYTSNGSLTVTLDLSDNVGGSDVASYYVDSAKTDHAAGSFDVNLTARPTPYTISVTDNVGKVSGTLTVTVLQDTSPPSIAMKTATATTVFPSNGTVASGSTVFTQNDAVSLLVTSADSESSVASVKATSSGTTIDGSFDSGTGIWTIVLPPGKTYTVRAKNKLDMEATQTVTITKDNTAPKITMATYNSNKLVISHDETGSGMGTPTMPGSTGLGTHNDSTTEFTGITTEGPVVGTFPDKVGNQVIVKWYVNPTGSTKVPLAINMPAVWTVSASSPYTVSNFASYGISSYSLENKTSGGTTVENANLQGSATIGNLSEGKQYLLTVYTKDKDHQNDSDTKKLEILFTMGAGTITASPSVLGNSALTERLPIETIVATERKQYLERARSSSRTNLPVWFSDVGKTASASPAQASGTTRVPETTTSGVSRSAGVSTSTRSVSVEALHAAALGSSQGKFSADERSSVGSSAEVAKVADYTVNRTFVAVMTAPEGSPAFVAYARGLADLRDRADGTAVTRFDRSSFTVTEDPRPSGLWDRILSFFGFRERETGGSQSAGFAFR